MNTNKFEVKTTEITFEHILYSPNDVKCSDCNQACECVWNVTRIALDLAVDYPKALLVEVGVHYCENCKHYFRLCPPFLRPGATYTNRVVQTALDSVFEDGMAVSRVALRMSRDFWLGVSEGIIRCWCKKYTEEVAHTWENDYQPWVIQSFSGVLCVDEIYQNNLALLLAVDPRNDKLMGYQLVHGNGVDSTQMQEFLKRLKDAGIEPEQVVTDGAAIYPKTIARIWSEAAHQMCLFHQSRLLSRAALKSLNQLKKQIPIPPPKPKNLIGRLPPGEERDMRIALVFKMRDKGMALHAIARETGHSINSVRRWLRGTVKCPEILPEVPDELLKTPKRQTTAIEEPRPAPEAWLSWKQVRETSKDLHKLRYKLLALNPKLTKEELARIDALLNSPIGESLTYIRGSLKDWHSIWWDSKDERRSLNDAEIRYEQWRTNKNINQFSHLAKVQATMDAKQFNLLSSFLEAPHRKATSNAAERKGRTFRHLQAPHFNWRTDTMLKTALNTHAISQMRRLRGEVPRLGAVSSGRGRKPVVEQPQRVTV